MTRFAQFSRIVSPEMKDARHVFRGLNRPLLADSDSNADGGKLAFSWTPPTDYQWVGREGGRPKAMGPLAGRVFVVLVSPNTHEDFSAVDGWIERWNWVEASSTLPDAPVDHETRYASRIWSSE